MADHRKTNIRFEPNLGIDYVAFSGGGAKGPAYLGVLKQFIEHDILDKIKGFSGTSVGALIAVLAWCNPTLYH